MAPPMSAKRIITTHLWLTLILGLVLGPALVVVDNDDSGNVLLSIPVMAVVLFIGYTGPVIAGVLALVVLQRRYAFLSLTTYLVASYVLLVLLLVQVVASRHETDSGMALLATPSLPVVALIATIAIAALRRVRTAR
jgi:hypothetical protein